MNAFTIKIWLPRYYTQTIGFAMHAVQLVMKNASSKYIMHLSMFSPRRGGGGGADVGHLIRLVLLRVGNLTVFSPFSH